MRAFIVTALVPLCALPCAHARAAEGVALDETVDPGHNYDKAVFKLWYPRDSGLFRGALILVPGSNADGRTMADDPVWQAFATKHRFAIVACYYTDKPHDQAFVEKYADVSRGSGQALLDALTRFAARARHPELATAPLLLWGMSAGGEFNYEFTAWKPERVIAFVVNKGGIYYSALTSRAARAVPGLLFTGGKDLPARTATIAGLFAVNRRAGARWALTEEPTIGHVEGRSRALTLVFFEEVLPLRLGDLGPPLKELSESSGFLGDTNTKRYHAAGRGAPSDDACAWLPTERVARAWQALVTDASFAADGP